MELTIEERLARIESVLPVPENVDVKFIAGKMAVSETYLRNHRYLLPNFGVSDVPGRLLWGLELTKTWLETSATHHQRAWDNLTGPERSRTMRGWKS